MGARKVLWIIYKLLRKTIIPSLKDSQLLYEGVIKHYVGPDVTWLDLGCGHQLLPISRFDEERSLVRNAKRIVGIDRNMPSLREHRTLALKICGDVGQLPFQNDSFQMVTANMVVEHFRDSETQFREISRLLSPGGFFIFHTPNSLGYMVILGKLIPEFIKGKLIYWLEGREEKDVFPTFYQANSHRKIKDVATACGFKITNIKMVVSDAELAVIPPLAFLELLWIRILMNKIFKPFRPNVIAILQKECVISYPPQKSTETGQSQGYNTHG